MDAYIRDAVTSASRYVVQNPGMIARMLAHALAFRLPIPLHAVEWLANALGNPAGDTPVSVESAYRVGDSITNIISPLMPYLPIIIVFAKKYDRDAGIGTILASMLPYSIAFLLGWTVMLLIWVYAGIPLGPGASATY